MQFAAFFFTFAQTDFLFSQDAVFIEQ